MDTDGVQSVERTGQAVELVYRTTRADLEHALRARDAHTAAGRRRRWAFPVGGTLGLGFSVLATVWGEPLVGKPLLFLACGVALWVHTLFGPRLQARAFAGMLEKAGETRTVVDDSGVLVTAATCRTHIGWEAQPTYVETAEAFLMLSDDKRAVAMTVLPKRGIRAPADADGLRAVLDAHLRRR
ncbi:hypothetical protein [Streptomyces sp. NPDC058674]|uniref:hypothetical protein n=1 Tax=Streptomyces sp. NPDC058674 TaxID=3346592 RepID=UPI00364EEF0B